MKAYTNNALARKLDIKLSLLNIVLGLNGENVPIERRRYECMVEECKHLPVIVRAGYLRRYGKS